MNTAIFMCGTCMIYTLKSSCTCGSPTLPSIPPKFSPDDRHSHLIRQAKEEERKTKGWIHQ